MGWSGRGRGVMGLILIMRITCTRMPKVGVRSVYP